MRPTPYVASLRVYEPLSSFNKLDQILWSQIPVTADTTHEEQQRALRRTIVTEPPASKPDGAYVLEIDGKRYVAPWSTAVRCWAALGDFKTTLPASVGKFFLSKEYLDAFSVDSDSVEDKYSHIISATWNIPPRWFALFEPSDRVVGYNKYGPFTIIRTSISNAKQKCVFAHQAVVNAFGNGPIEQEIADLLGWLSIFEANSIIECDYGGLALYLEKSLVENGQPGLSADTSIEDVAESLAGLAAGDGALAGQGYERLVTRWRQVAAFEHAI